MPIEKTFLSVVLCVPYILNTTHILDDISRKRPPRKAEQVKATRNGGEQVFFGPFLTLVTTFKVIGC